MLQWGEGGEGGSVFFPFWQMWKRIEKFKAILKQILNIALALWLFLFSTPLRSSKVATFSPVWRGLLSLSFTRKLVSHRFILFLLLFFFFFNHVCTKRTFTDSTHVCNHCIKKYNNIDDNTPEVRRWLRSWTVVAVNASPLLSIVPT